MTLIIFYRQCEQVAAEDKEKDFEAELLSHGVQPEQLPSVLSIHHMFPDLCPYECKRKFNIKVNKAVMKSLKLGEGADEVHKGGKVIGRLGSVPLQEKDLKCLDDGRYLNDNIVTGWLEVLSERYPNDSIDIESCFLYSHLVKLTRTQVCRVSLTEHILG